MKNATIALWVFKKLLKVTGLVMMCTGDVSELVAGWVLGAAEPFVAWDAIVCNIEAASCGSVGGVFAPAVVAGGVVPADPGR